MCDQMIYDPLHSATFLRVSADGRLLLRWPSGRVTPPCGPAHVRVNLSARQARGKVLLTSGTYGPLGTGSSSSAALQRSLESRLRAATDLAGLTLYRLTWKVRATPSGRQIFALRGSARPISETGYGSWPTPSVRDYKDTGDLGKSRYRRDGRERQDTIPRVAWMVGWATPTASDARRGVNPPRPQDTGIPLTQQVGMLVALGANVTGSLSRMEKSGRLNPDHSRWLMGYPEVWQRCACAVTATQSFRKSRRGLSTQQGAVMIHDEALTILGLIGHPTEAEIRGAYRRKVLTAHPDHNPLSGVLVMQLADWRTARDLLTGTPPPDSACHVCKGRGMVVKGLTQMPCPACGGSGDYNG